jgi:hypothetical protein
LYAFVYKKKRWIYEERMIAKLTHSPSKKKKHWCFVLISCCLSSSSSSVLAAHIHSHLDIGGDINRSDGSDNRGGGLQIQDSLVDSHLPSVPGVGTLTTRTLSSGDSEVLGGQSNGTSHSHAFLQSLGLELGAESFESRHISGSKSDSDSLDGFLTLGGGNIGLNYRLGHLDKT